MILSWAIILFMHQKMSKGGWKRGNSELNLSPQHVQQSSLTWYHQQESGLLEWTSGKLGRTPYPPSSSFSLPLCQCGHRTSVWIPALHFPTFLSEDLNLSEPHVFRSHMRHVLCTHVVAMEAMDATGIYSFSLEGKVHCSSNKNSNE